MKPSLNENDLRTFVDLTDVTTFISDNLPMEWNKTIDFMRKHGICSGSDREFYFYDKSDIDEMDGEEKYWMNEFFKAHPFLDKIVVVFTD